MISKCIPKGTSKWEPKLAHVSILIQNAVKMGTQNSTPKWDPAKLEARIFYRKNWGFETKKLPERIPRWTHKWTPPKDVNLKLKPNNLNLGFHFGLHFESPK